VPTLVGHPVDRDLVDTGQLALTLDQGDAAGLDQTGQAAVQTTDDLVLVLVDTGHVDCVERGPDTELLAGPHRVGDLTRVQQGLGRNTAVVQAGAAELVFLNQGDTHAEFGGADGGRVATATAAQDDEIECAAAFTHGKDTPFPAV